MKARVTGIVHRHKIGKTIVVPILIKMMDYKFFPEDFHTTTPA
jgi:hypothetical protein